MTDKEIMARVKKINGSGPRGLSTIHAVRKVIRNKVPGCFVECGVWKGAQAMMMAFTLQDMGEGSRDIYLYDTFKGMTPPTEVDIAQHPEVAKRYEKHVKGDHVAWCYAGIEEVRGNMEKTGYDMSRVHFVEGNILQTLPANNPPEIAVLRLDTDFYDSTRHELEHLWPLLNIGGCLLLDDYRHWGGCTQAVDEYFGDRAAALRPLQLSKTGAHLTKTNALE